MARNPRPRAKRRRKSSAKPKQSSLRVWLNKLDTLHMASDPDDRGACLVKDPTTGQTMCIRTSSDTCKALGGVFQGGPCGA